ncbi:unnamed protein product [Trifolium pratense]|uniref:Uncharacterized protein n=1 Tax=Trifolium pratense TaxID=57577 RepID=A0ACB0IAD4_TRIPR|nr:unnamed protein product [Trifolium pratense]
MACSCLCSPKFLAIIVLLTSIPIGIIISLERTQSQTHVYHYHTNGGGWFRECAKWDSDNNRFIISFFEGGIGQISVPEKKELQETVLEEEIIVKETELAGNASLGLTIDRSRNRILVVNADVLGNRYSGVVAYDLSTWKRLFLTKLSGYGDEKSFADDVAVDAEGNAYITDAKASKIWKVGVNGNLISVIRSPLFTPKEWYKTLVGLNGIVYHPDGFLIVIHTFSGNLFKIDLTKEEDQVKIIKVIGGPLYFGDGLELLSPNKVVIAGSNPSGRLVESLDGWNTASVVATFSGPRHRLATAATVKDGKVYLNHLVGIGYPKKKHAIVEAVF